MNRRTLALIGVFTLGIVAGALASPWLPGMGAVAQDRRLSIIVDELTTEFGAAPVQSALTRAEARIAAAGLY